MSWQLIVAILMLSASIFINTLTIKNIKENATQHVALTGELVKLVGDLQKEIQEVKVSAEWGNEVTEVTKED